MSDRLEIHDRVLAASDREELMDAYAEWAAHYDADLVEGQGYVAPVLAAQRLADALEDRGAAILDAGCGTGLVGAALAEHGFTALTGADYSQEMLARAESLGVYGALRQVDLTARLPDADDAFTAVICVGTLTLGHVGPEALREFVRVVRPGGLVCFTVREEAFAQDDYASVLAALTQEGAWASVSDELVDYIRGEGSHCRLCLYRVLP